MLSGYETKKNLDRVEANLLESLEKLASIESYQWKSNDDWALICLIARIERFLWQILQRLIKDDELFEHPFTPFGWHFLRNCDENKLDYFCLGCLTFVPDLPTPYFRELIVNAGNASLSSKKIFLLMQTSDSEESNLEFSRAYFRLLKALATISPTKCALSTGLPLSITQQLSAPGFDKLAIEVLIRNRPIPFRPRGTANFDPLFEASSDALRLAKQKKLTQDRLFGITKAKSEHVLVRQSVDQKRTEFYLRRVAHRYHLKNACIRDLAELTGYSTSFSENISRRIARSCDDNEKSGYVLTLDGKTQTADLVRALLSEVSSGKAIEAERDLLELLPFASFFALSFFRYEIPKDLFGVTLSEVIKTSINQVPSFFQRQQCGQERGPVRTE